MANHGSEQRFPRRSRGLGEAYRVTGATSGVRPGGSSERSSDVLVGAPLPLVPPTVIGDETDGRPTNTTRFTNLMPYHRQTGEPPDDDSSGDEPPDDGPPDGDSSDGDSSDGESSDGEDPQQARAGRFRFSNAEKTDMYKVYILSGEKSSLALQQYRQKFPDRVQPHRTFFARLDNNLKQYGSFKKPRKPRIHTATNDDNAINVLAAIELQPTTSLRAIQRQSISPITSARRILKKYRYHPYKLRNVQTFHGGDAERRLVYVRRMIHERINLREILWTDESTFTNQGVNHQNTRYFRFISKMARWILDFLLSLCSLSFL